jgi:histidine triad (HIT) family protein
MGCVFCDIVAGQAPAHRVWENADYLAFLSIFPNTLGVTVVIPKHHYTSYAFDLPEHVLQGLVGAAKIVGKRLDASFPDVGRTGLIFEGFGVDHVHAKLFPMHGTAEENWRHHTSSETVYFQRYPGYLSSHDANRADDGELAQLAIMISEAGN